MNEEYDETPYIDVYPVGLLSDLKYGRLRGIRGSLARKIQRRDWHGLRQYFNGYLAEVTYGNLVHRKAGRGWTKRAALSSLGRRLGEDNKPEWMP